MRIFKRFPCLLVLVASVAACAPYASAQSTTASDATGRLRLENDLIVVPTIPFREDEPEIISTSPVAPSSLSPLEQMLLAAIDERIGVPYRMGAEGPYRYDCSGFVWSVFQTAGVPFERGSARNFWSRFAPATDDEKYKFGTLVFFNHLKHVGIVAGEGGFYHASSSRGVMYSPFSEYWSKRVIGFRRVELITPGQFGVAGR